MLNFSDYSDSNKLFDNHYRLLKPLSTEGGTADVWLAIDVNTIDTSFDEIDSGEHSNENSGMLVAIKIYRPKNALDIEGEQRFRDELFMNVATRTCFNQPIFPSLKEFHI